MDIFDILAPSQEEEKSANVETSYERTLENVFVVSIGGSVFIDGKPNAPQLSKLADVIERLHSQNYQFALVVGGGQVAREYVAAAKSLGANNFVQDAIGIAITKANAQLMIAALKTAWPQIPNKIIDSKGIIAAGKIPVYAGIIPGFTTDTVAALLAEYLNATFINLTDVDGIYTADPKSNSNAKIIREMNYEKLFTLLKLYGSKPGQNVVLDLPTCLILRRSKIKTFVMSGKDFTNFENAVVGKEWYGTKIWEPSNEV